MKYEAQDDFTGHTCVILCHAQHSKEICCQYEDGDDTAATEAAPAETVTVAAPIAISAPVAVAAASGVSIEDALVKAVEILGSIVAQS